MTTQAVQTAMPPMPQHRTGQRYAPAVENRHVIEDVEWLASWGTPFWEIAQRLGKSSTALERALFRWGRHDLAALNHDGRWIR